MEISYTINVRKEKELIYKKVAEPEGTATLMMWENNLN